MKGMKKKTHKNVFLKNLAPTVMEVYIQSTNFKI